MYCDPPPSPQPHGYVCCQTCHVTKFELCCLLENVVKKPANVQKIFFFLFAFSFSLLFYLNSTMLFCTVKNCLQRKQTDMFSEFPSVLLWPRSKHSCNIKPFCDLCPFWTTLLPVPPASRNRQRDCKCRTDRRSHTRIHTSPVQF